MYFQLPPPTQFDLNFNLAHVPVRVNPWFWVMGLLICGGSSFEPVALLLSIGVFFISVLLHELGHVMMMEWFGERGAILLYMNGGLAIPRSDIWNLGYRSDRRSVWEQILISAAGPLTTFLLAGFGIALVYAVGGYVKVFFVGIIPLCDASFPNRDISNVAQNTIQFLINLNIFLGLLNSLPAFPLDGGQIARQLFIMHDRAEGLTRSLWVSIFVHIGICVYAMRSGSIFMVVVFGMMAYNCYQELQMMGRRW